MKLIPCPVSRDDLYRMVWVDKQTTQGIAAKIPGGTPKRVRSWMHKYGIPVLPKWGRNIVAPIEGQLQSLLVGSMLGDGRIVCHKNASYYSEFHCTEQRAYLEWKSAMWEPWDRSIREMEGGARLDTASHESLTPWRDLFYRDRLEGWKLLTPKVVDLVDEFALAVWYMDDGHAGWWPQIIFGQEESGRKVAFQIFEKFKLYPTWGLHTISKLEGGKTGSFFFDTEEQANRFVGIVTPYVPLCMESKISNLGFMGPHYQVRRRLANTKISEMASKGIPIYKIAGDIGVGETTLGRHMTEQGIRHPDRWGRRSDEYTKLHPLSRTLSRNVYVDLDGTRVKVVTATLKTHTKTRWSLGLRSQKEVDDHTEVAQDIYSCLCLDETGTKVVAEYRIPVLSTNGCRVIHIYPTGGVWEQYRVPQPGNAEAINIEALLGLS